MFEVGKKYRLNASEGVWICKAAYGSRAIMERECDKQIEFASMPKYWEEIKPLTFADLKPGEKFKLGNSNYYFMKLVPKEIKFGSTLTSAICLDLQDNSICWIAGSVKVTRVD